eukprot:scaffold7099_cov281-Pinguiococcus_pyrenoidosus.AAC.29
MSHEGVSFLPLLFGGVGIVCSTIKLLLRWLGSSTDGCCCGGRCGGLLVGGGDMPFWGLACAGAPYV